ncbi:glycosyltransferase family 2 protein [Paenibacillus taiwanensis]|uniref:glycosyltransferase family 2 protein n=1 Tax=Paenibacillus taiwanensis TaxID=401638 RepID=UPI000420BB6A|nr:glycosyltransferase [Paenibacillus taiwanensis]
MQPLVTVVIPFYNDPYVDQAINSALLQTYAQVEIIVVDDGSLQYAERATRYQPRIYYLSKANGGTATALNHGIKYASGKYIAWLSSDDLFYPDKIKHQVQYMEERGAHISFTNFDYIDAFNSVTKHRAAATFHNVIEFYESFFRINPINGCTVMMSRKMLDVVGCFDESLPFTHDLDLWYRAMLAGFEFHYIDTSLTAYRWHDAMGTMRHRDAIIHEVASTNGRYHGRLAAFINQLNIR